MPYTLPSAFAQIATSIPIIIGDILTSSNDKPDVFDSPTIAENLMEYLSEERDFYPYSHKQKIYNITNNFCFAFAGLNSVAKKFLEDLKINFGRNKWVELKELQEYLNNRGIADIIGKVDFIIVLIEKHGSKFASVTIPFVSVLSEKLPLFDDINVIGSGGRSFIDSVKRVDNKYTPATITPGEAIATNMALISSILGRERAELHTYEDDWGAGFEMVFFDGEKFLRYENGCYVYMHALVDQYGYMDLPTAFKITHYRYINELLIITDIEAAKGNTQEIGDLIVYTFEAIKRRCFFVPPIDFVDEIDKAKYSADLSFSSRKVTFGYIIEGNGKFFPATFHDKDVEVDFVDGLSLRIKMPRESIDKIAEIVLSKHK